MLDPSSFTLTSNGSNSGSPSISRQPSSPGASSSGGGGGGHAHGARIMVNDPRWHFKDESLFPKPRDFHSKPRKYRAGRGSSVPLDLSSL